MPKGTFTTSLNTQAACTPCNTGVTTAAEGSSSAAACDRASQGYSYNGDGTASECEVNSYNDGETTAATCTRCPNGAGCWMCSLRTREQAGLFQSSRC